MRWLRVKRRVQGRVTPSNTSGLERSKCALLAVDTNLGAYHKKKMLVDS